MNEEARGKQSKQQRPRCSAYNRIDLVEFGYDQTCDLLAGEALARYGDIPGASSQDGRAFVRAFQDLSGGLDEAVPDRFFDFGNLTPKLFCKLFDGFTRLVSVRHSIEFDAALCEKRATEAIARIDGDVLWR